MSLRVQERREGGSFGAGGGAACAGTEREGMNSAGSWGRASQVGARTRPPRMGFGEGRR